MPGTLSCVLLFLCPCVPGRLFFCLAFACFNKRNAPKGGGGFQSTEAGGKSSIVFLLVAITGLCVTRAGRAGRLYVVDVLLKTKYKSTFKIVFFYTRGVSY